MWNEINRSVTDLFTKGSHHRNLSVVYIVQNLFNNGKEHRTISLNSHYIVVFKNPRDISQIVHLAKQAYPGKVKAGQEVFKDTTSAPFGYLLLKFIVMGRGTARSSSQAPNNATQTKQKAHKQE